jgi:hypothetical protein
LREREQHRVSNAKTPFRRSIRCTLPAEVDEDEASEYYDSWEYLDKPASISLIGAYAARALQNDLENFIALISMQDIMAQHEKEALDEIDPRETLLVQYHEFMDVCSAAAADRLPQHHKRDHHIELEPGKEPDWIPRLYRQTWEEKEEVRCWVTENLSKSFIEASQAPWASPIMFVKKPGRGIRLCVDYRKLNAITKKDRHPLPLIDETMASVASCTIMTKLDIRKAFNRIRMATTEDKDLTTFCTLLGNFKSKVLPFGLCNRPTTF